MSNYNQVGQGKTDQKQQGNTLGAGQDPQPLPGGQAELPDQSDPKSRMSDERIKKDARGAEKGLVHQRPGLEGG